MSPVTQQLFWKGEAPAGAAFLSLAVAAPQSYALAAVAAMLGSGESTASNHSSVAHAALIKKALALWMCLLAWTATPL